MLRCPHRPSNLDSISVSDPLPVPARAAPVGYAVKVPPAVRLVGGKWRLACKAFNRNGDTQPRDMSDCWNFRSASEGSFLTSGAARAGR